MIVVLMRPLALALAVLFSSLAAAPADARGFGWLTGQHSAQPYQDRRVWVGLVPTKLRVRAAGVEVPSDHLRQIARAVKTMHRERSYPISNLCYKVSIDVARAAGRAGQAQADACQLLYCNSLSQHAGPMPDGWKQPIGYGNHWITYLHKDGLHYAVDGTARDYLDRQRRGLPYAAEVLVADSPARLKQLLTRHYGGMLWETWTADGGRQLGCLAESKQPRPPR